MGKTWETGHLSLSVHYHGLPGHQFVRPAAPALNSLSSWFLAFNSLSSLDFLACIASCRLRRSSATCGPRKLDRRWFPFGCSNNWRFFLSMLGPQKTTPITKRQAWWLLLPCCEKDHLPINSGQLIIFHQPRFPWNKVISRNLSYLLGAPKKLVCSNPLALDLAWASMTFCGKSCGGNNKTILKQTGRDLTN